jgi:hypothetical protein
MALPRSHLIDHDSKRPDIAAGGGIAALELFRRQVQHRSCQANRGDRRCLQGLASHIIWIRSLGKSEIEDFCVTVWCNDIFNGFRSELLRARAPAPKLRRFGVRISQRLTWTSGRSELIRRADGPRQTPWR